MSRTLLVAGSLAILIFALWIVQLAKVGPFLFGTGAHATDASAPAATASADAATTAVDDLAGWPIAAGR
jgi:hypothetical protein